MTNNSALPSRINISRLVVLALITLFLITGGVTTHGARFGRAADDDPLVKANRALSDAQGALDSAEARKTVATIATTKIEQFNTDKSALIDLQNALADLRRLTQTVASLFDEAEGKSLQTQLQEAQANLAKAKDTLTASKDDLDRTTTSTPSIDAAKKAVANKLQAVTSFPDLSDKGDVVKNLNAALAKVYDKVKTLADSGDKKLLLFKQDGTDPSSVFNLYKNNLVDFPSLMQFDQDFQERWSGLAAALKRVVSDHDTKTTPVDKAAGTLHASVAEAVQKIRAQIATLTAYAKARDGAITATGELFKSDPKAHEIDALDGINESASIAATLDKINSIIRIIDVQAAASIPSFDRTTTDGVQKVLDDQLKHLSQTAANLQETLSGDRSFWITEKIKLYYFTDIPRLIKTLNPTAKVMGGDDEARARAVDRLDRLRAAEDAQSEANSKVAGLKKQVAGLKLQLQQANDQLSAANILAQMSKRKDDELNRRPAADVSAERKARSAEEKNQREQERVDAQQRADKLNDENTGLAARLTKAESELEAAQGDFERTNNATIRAAQAESAAFASARDNAPFWFAGASAVSSDPARRVEITSSTGGENAIFVRGRREDIVMVKDIVVALDEPAPQARLTLWKIELNSDATKKGAEKFNKSLEIVEQELASTRARIASALSLLLESINEEAELAAAAKTAQETARTTAQKESDRKDCLERDIYTNYAFPLDPGVTDISGRTQRRRRYALYSEQVQQELGVEFLNVLGFDDPKQFGLKDPASATTLNEALIVLLLTNREHRTAIMNRFQDRLDSRLSAVTSVVQSKRATKNSQLISLSRHFARLDSMLNVNSLATTSVDQEMTRQQEELVYALRGLLLRHLTGRITGLQDRIDLFIALHDKPIRTPRETVLYQCLQEKLPRIFDTIHDEFPISAFAALTGRVRLIPSSDGTVGVQQYERNPNEPPRPKGPPQIFSLRPSPARVAAADGMLDVFSKAFEDDVDREYVQPMLRDLRVKMKSSGIGFGTIQRTSVLATNRLIARVDPRATAELAVGEETNLIQGLQQISQLTLAAQTGGAAGILGAFKSQANDETPPEIYGITSGSAFQVTPIFDPTGQALRFKFDFVDTTLVREPKGTINPRLPRVERHTVNTEVQLANLEIREVSRFESDSKIGLPTTYKGGLPLLKDIPGVRPVPFIGWFVRRKGSNAIAQRSLIFAQTTMSPTIGDILDLLDTSLQRR